jgi:hypothetical protein
MRVMRWDWQQYNSTPVFVIDEIIRQLNNESEDSASAEGWE